MGKPMPVNPRFGATLLWLMQASRAPGVNMHRAVLMSVYGSDIAVRLKRIHAHAERDGPKGWLVAALRGRRPAYVRCRFADADNLRCEAFEGGFQPNVDQARSPPPGLSEALKALGYWPDAVGRALFDYQITADSAVWGGASVVILDPLIGIFGARVPSKIDIIAPLAPDRDEAAIERHLRE